MVDMGHHLYLECDVEGEKETPLPLSRFLVYAGRQVREAQIHIKARALRPWVPAGWSPDQFRD